MTELATMALSDGRILEYADSGASTGRVLVWHHGTPGSGSQARFLVDACAERGLRLVTMTRPGYARSSRLAGRTVADVVADTAALLDHLGITRALVGGASGGGPHSLACAALLPDRFAASLVVAGVAPYAAAGLDFLAGMGEDNVLEFGAALAGEGPLREFLEGELPGLKDVTAAGLILALQTLLPAVDVAALTGDVGEDLAKGMVHAVSAGVDGWLDDDVAFLAPWGFDLASITVPVSLWQGDEDLMVPFAHGQWLAAALPTARVHLEAGQGHLSIGIASMGRMLDELLALADNNGGSWAVIGDWLDTATVTAQDLRLRQTRRTRGGDFSWPPAGTSTGHHRGL
jgi:pimeloyl-ACP methyl ester carboxylesterase